MKFSPLVRTPSVLDRPIIVGSTAAAFPLATDLKPGVIGVVVNLVLRHIVGVMTVVVHDDGQNRWEFVDRSSLPRPLQHSIEGRTDRFLRSRA